MNQGLVTALQAVGSMNRQEAATALASAFAAVGAGRHTVRAAQDAFNAIVAQARNGTPQLIGRKAKDMTVVMSLADLVDIIQIAAKKQSFGEALDAAGFQPVSGQKIEIRERFPSKPLVWRRLKGPDNE